MAKEKTDPNEYIDEINTKLESLNSFIREVQVPAELVPAITANRAALIKLARVRELSAAECKALYDLIGALLETNAALRQHTAEVGKRADIIAQNLKGSINYARAAARFANFNRAYESEG